jgi:G3E family GTPase
VRGFNLNPALGISLKPTLRPVFKPATPDRISTLVLRTDTPLDIDRLSDFMNALLEEHGKQLLRYKGVLNIAGEDRRLVFQGVLKLYGFDWDAEWKDGESRESVMVFIADELPEEKIRAGFEALAHA